MKSNCRSVPNADKEKRGDVVYGWYVGLTIRPCWLKLLLNNLTTI